jgi:hypothetical protein
MTTHNLINDEENHNLIQPYDGSHDPTHFEDENESSIEEEEEEFTTLEEGDVTPEKMEEEYL